MKLNKHLLLAALIGMFAASEIQAQQTGQLISNTLAQDPTIATHFIEGMIRTGLSLNCDPWDDDAPCTDLCDPWDDDAPCPNTSLQQAKIAASPELQASIIKNTMLHFEAEVAKGKGGKYLTTKLLSQAKRKYSGKSLKSLRARFNTYIKHLKSLQ